MLESDKFFGEKLKQSKGIESTRVGVMWSWVVGPVSLLKSMLQVDLVEQMRFEKWFENGKGSSLVDSGEKRSKQNS